MKKIVDETKLKTCEVKNGLSSSMAVHPVV